MIRKLLHPCSSDHNSLITDSIDATDLESWQQIVGDDSIYLSPAYLKALESAGLDLSFNYAIIRNKANEAVCVAYFQIVEFKDLDKVYKDWLRSNYGEHLFNKVIPELDLKIMICGNLFSCGEHGFAYSDKISREKAYELVASAMETASKNGKDNSSILLIKELYPENDPNFDAFSKESFIPFQIDCNMVLKISPDWKEAEDYYSCMQSKYRTKAKAAFKRSTSLNIRELNVNEMEDLKAEIDILHANVVDQADFSLGELNAQAFIALKTELKDKMRFTGYFLNEELIGFSVAILSNDFLEATHVGLNYDHNIEHGLYQRILHDFVEMTLEHNMKELRLGRTAEQIKSTLGAEPIHMRLYLRHKHSLVNPILKPLVERIKPTEFEFRKPFKAKYYEEWTL